MSAQIYTGAALTANPRPLRTDLSYPACIASGNFILEFPSINSRSRLFSRWRVRASPRGLWSRRQVWLPRMRQRDACWAGEVSLKGSHFATMRDSSPVSRYLYIDLCKYTTCYLNAAERSDAHIQEDAIENRHRNELHQNTSAINGQHSLFNAILNT